MWYTGAVRDWPRTTAAAGHIHWAVRFLFIVLWSRVLDPGIFWETLGAQHRRRSCGHCPLFASQGQELARVFRRPCTSDSNRWWFTVFEGEGALDCGGPFRDTLTLCAMETMSNALPLFLPSPNNVNNTGPNRDCFVPRSAATSPAARRAYRFFGHLLGGAARTDETLPLMFPAPFWKLLVGHEPVAEDLRAFDAMCHTGLHHMNCIEEQGIDADTFGCLFCLCPCPAWPLCHRGPKGKPYPLPFARPRPFATLHSVWGCAPP